MEDSMSKTPKPAFYSNVPISQPVIAPSLEDHDMNGFAWSHDCGMIIKMNRIDDPEPDLLKTLRDNKKFDRSWAEQ